MSQSDPPRRPVPYLLHKETALRIYMLFDGSHYEKLKAVQQAVLRQHGILDPVLLDKTEKQPYSRASQQPGDSM